MNRYVGVLTNKLIPYRTWCGSDGNNACPHFNAPVDLVKSILVEINLKLIGGVVFYF